MSVLLVRLASDHQLGNRFKRMMTSSQAENWVQVVNKRAPVYYRTCWQLLHLCLVGPHTARLATTTLSSCQPDSNLVNEPSPLPDRASGISCPLTSKPSRTLVILGANLRNLFLIFVGIPLAHTNIVLGHRSFVCGNIDSVLLYCIVLYCKKRSSQY